MIMKEKKATVLVVDDSPINLATIEQKLENEYDVVPLNSGIRALRYLKDERPDLILLDIRMADKDGIETLKELREMDGCEKIPVIMLTSQSDRDSIIETQKLGIYDYVLKPFDTQDLHARIKRALERARKEANEQQD